MACIKDNQKMNYHKKPPLPVDRGWAWFIMIGAYVIMLVAYSLARSLSIFLPDILDRYNEPATVTTLAFGVGDLSFTITNIAIPSLLLPRFNVRTLALCGAFLHCFGVISLAYSPNIIIFNCLFAIFGVSGGLMIVTSLIHLGHYFKKRLSFASAVTQIGASTAMVLVPRLAQFLKETYGYQGALLIIGGISLHCVAAAMLLWPVSMFDDPNHAKKSVNGLKNPLQKLGNTIPTQMSFIIEAQEEGQENEINEKSTFLQVLDLNTKQINELNSTSDLKMTAYILKEQLQTENKEDVQNSELIPLCETSTTRSASQSIQEELHTKSSLFPDLALDTKVSNKSDIYSQNEQFISSPNDKELDLNTANNDTLKQSAIRDPQELNVLRSSMEDNLSSAEENLSNQTALIQNGSNDNQDGTLSIKSKGCCSLQKIKASLSSSILLNPVALMLVLAGGMSTPGGNMYLPVLALENGLSPGEVAWMLTIIGIADILGKLSIGYFADLGYVRPIRIACFTQFTVGMVCQFTSFYKSFGPMAGMAIIFGMMTGVVQSLLPAMIIEMLGLPYLAQVISVFYLSIGVFNFVLNVAVGAIKDATGSFLGGFNFLGGMMLTSCVILMLEPAFVRCRDKFGKHGRTLVKRN